jgi:hypothetical protein
MEVVLAGRLNLTGGDFVLSEAPLALSIASRAIPLPAGGGVPLGIGVSGFDFGDAVSVTISGLASYETVTDNLDHTTFSGGHAGSVTLTAAEVNSSLTLNSSYTGSGQPVNANDQGDRSAQRYTAHHKHRRLQRRGFRIRNWRRLGPYRHRFRGPYDARLLGRQQPREPCGE